MPELNDISLHQLVAQWEKDLETHTRDFMEAKAKPEINSAPYLKGRADELEGCIKELKQVIGLLP